MKTPLFKTLKRSVKFLPLALFIIIALASCFTAYHFTFHITDSDAASELVLGKILADENIIITTDWFYSSEIRFFNTNLVYMPLFKIIDDWQTLRFVSSLIFQALLVGSYFYLSRRMKLSANAFFLSASLMLLPLSDIYGRFALYQNFYVPCFIYGFMIAGLYLSFWQHGGQKRHWQALRLAAMLALALMSCLNGFRQLPSTMLPLLLTALFVKLRDRSAPEGSSAFRWKHVWLAGLICAAGLAGLLIHTLLLPRYGGAESFQTPVMALISADNIRGLLTDYLTLFGYREGGRLFSLGGLIALGGAAAAVLMLVFSLATLFKREKPGTAAFAATMYPVSMILTTVIFVLISGYENYARYYMQAFIWIYPFLGVMLDWRGVTPRTITLKQALIALTCLLMAVSGVNMHLYYHNAGDQTASTLSGVSTDIHEADRLRPVVDFLEEDGYEVGYATHWNANIITEMTDGRIPMITIIRVYPEFFYTYRDWMTNKQNRELSFVEDKYVFLLLTRDEADIFSGSELAAFAIPVYTDENFTVFTFDFSTEVWDYLLEEAKAMNQTSVLAQLLPEGD